MRLTNANNQISSLWNNLTVFLSITLTISLSLSTLLLPTTWALSDKRLCADEKCERIISTGSARITYTSGDEGMLSFKINSPVRIMSKSAGSDPQLWGVEINGRRGYANKQFIMEKKIYISEKDLKFERPVVQLVNPVDPAVPAAPELTPEQLLTTVLNSSETADEAATATTTSPLDTLKLAILTEQDQSSSHEASTPIAPAQAKLQLVDGTELPLEAVPATTEKMENLTKLEQNVLEKGENDDEYDEYEEDDEANYEDDEGATLDSKDNDIPNDKVPEKIVDSIDKVVELPVQAVNLSNEPVKTPFQQKILENITTNANETEVNAGKIGAPVVNTIEKVTQPAVEINLETPKTEELIQTPLKTEETKPETVTEEIAVQKAEVELKGQLELEKKANEELKAQEVERQKAEEARKLQEEEKRKSEEAIKAQEEERKKAEEAIKTQEAEKQKAEDAIKVQEAEKQKTEAIKVQEAERQKAEDAIKVQEAERQKTADTIKAQEAERLKEEQPKAQDAEKQKVEDLLKAQSTETIEASQLSNETEALPSEKVEAQPLTQIIEAQSKDQLIPEVQADIPVESIDKMPETQQAEAVVQIEVPSVKEEDKPKQDDAQKIKEERLESQFLQAYKKAQQIRDESVKTMENEAQKVKEEIGTQSSEAQVKEHLKPEVELREQHNQSSEQPENKARDELDGAQSESQTVTEQIIAASDPYNIPTTASAEELAVPASLPPLFKKDNFNNPNEYYKQLQEQQQQLVKEAAAQKQNQQQVPQQTTPNPASLNAYDAAYEAEPTPAPIAMGSVEPIGISPPAAEPLKEDAGPGLFGTIMNTVNSFISSEGRKEPETEPLTHNTDDDLHRLLYPDKAIPERETVNSQSEEGFCTRPMDGNCHTTITLDNFVEVLSGKLLDHSLLLLCVVIAAASSLFFIFVYYCFCNSSQEGALLAKLNHLERSLLTAHKENHIIKHDLMTTRTKLSSIEDNSFGSNDMVVALKKQLEVELYEKGKLQEQVSSLEKDLDNAAEAGLELNKMLSEVLNSQNGDEAFMSTVEELQRQLNDQEKIIIDINASLAEKSRENSELQYSYTESTTRLNSEMKSLQQDNYELEMEKAKLQTRLEEIQAETEQELAKALEARNYEMQRLQHQIMESIAKFDKEHNELQTSLAKIEALEDCLKAVKKDGKTNVQDLITSAKTRGELNAAHQKFLALQTKLEQELAAKTRLESQLQVSSADVEQLKQDFNQSERDKLEAQTRLEVLSGYFREKETELQKELSLQEAKWLQHQGENASTVETQTLMKNEIQTLKSQNDELRAEIEAQIASHKAQMGTLENRAHESWLAARQSERRCEEAQAEAAGLRRKLTTMGNAGAGGDITLDATLPPNGVIGAPELNSSPSPLPLPLPLPGSPGLLNMPNPLPFLPAPFSPFMGLPPPFLPPAAAAGGARLPPLGRMRSPPPNSSSRGDRYDHRDDYSDYDDYDDEEEDERGMDRRRRHSGNWGRAHHHHHQNSRDSYDLHSPRTYRSLSPSDSRYNYNDTEPDFSPPPSPPPRKNNSRPLNEV